MKALQGPNPTVLLYSLSYLVTVASQRPRHTR